MILSRQDGGKKRWMSAGHTCRKGISVAFGGVGGGGIEATRRVRAPLCGRQECALSVGGVGSQRASRHQTTARYVNRSPGRSGGGWGGGGGDRCRARERSLLAAAAGSAAPRQKRRKCMKATVDHCPKVSSPAACWQQHTHTHSRPACKVTQEYKFD